MSVNSAADQGDAQQVRAGQIEMSPGCSRGRAADRAGQGGAGHGS